MNRDTHDKVLDYLYDELPAGEREAFVQQLRRDPALEREVESLRGVRQVVARATPPAPPAALLQKLQREARLAAPAARESWVERFLAGLMRPATGVAFAALTIIGTGVYLSRTRQPSAARSPVGDVAILTADEKRELSRDVSPHATTIEPGDTPPTAAVPMPSPVVMPSAEPEGKLGVNGLVGAVGGYGAAGSTGSADPATASPGAKGTVNVEDGVAGEPAFADEAAREAPAADAGNAPTATAGLKAANEEEKPLAERAEGLVAVHVAPPTTAPSGRYAAEQDAGDVALRDLESGANVPSAAAAAAPEPPAEVAKDLFWRAPTGADSNSADAATRELGGVGAGGGAPGEARGGAAPNSDARKKVADKLEVFPVALGQRTRNNEAPAPSPQRPVNTLPPVVAEAEAAPVYAAAPPPARERAAGSLTTSLPSGDRPALDGALRQQQAGDAPEPAVVAGKEQAGPSAAAVAADDAPPAIIQNAAPPQTQARFGRRAEQLPNDAAAAEAFGQPAPRAPVQPQRGTETETLAAQRANRAVDALRRVADEEVQKSEAKGAQRDEAAPGGDAAGSPDDQRERARSFTGKGQLEQAAAEYAALLERYPAYAYRGAVLIDWASVELKLGRLEAARALLRRALSEPSIAATAKTRLAEVEAQLAARADDDAARKAAEGGKDTGNQPAQPAAPTEKTAETKPASSGAAPAKPAAPKQKVAAPRRSAAPSEDQYNEQSEPAKQL